MLSIEDVPGHILEATGARVSSGSVRRWIARGLRGLPLPATYVGGRPYVDPAAIAAWSKKVGDMKRAAAVARRKPAPA
jgi:hypothetical protein